MSPKLMVLYAEVMPYNVVCFQDFVATTGGEIVVVSWGIEKKLTPYVAPVVDRVTSLTLGDFNLQKLKLLITSLNPDALYISGRMEPIYLQAALFAKKRGIPVIGNADDQYTGNFKQLIYKVFSIWFWHRYFDFMMVPGLYQYEYMRYLGFKRDKIIFPQYCADTILFNNYYLRRDVAVKGKDYILFVGRLNEIKGLDILLDAYKELRHEKKLDLKLLIIGEGPLLSLIPIDADIHVTGFVGQEDIINLLPKVRFFCLPSRKEPWGLVVHEFAAAGLPIVTTTACGAATAFVKDGYNGYIVRPGDKELLKCALIKMANLKDEELRLFGDRSYELSKQIVPALWTSAIKTVIGK